MTRYEKALRARLTRDYEGTVRAYFKQAVEEWLEEGPEEVVRVLTLWVTREGGQPKLVVDLDTLIEMIKIKNDSESLLGDSPCRWAVYDGPAGVEPTDLLSRSETREEAHQDAYRAAQIWINEQLRKTRRGNQLPIYALDEINEQGGWVVFAGDDPIRAYLVVEEDPAA
jgi:hypothetical protein